MTDLFIKNNALIKSSVNPESGYVVHADNVKGLYNGVENSISYIINQLETRINNIQPSSFAPTLDGSGEKLLWLGGSISPTTITSGNTGTLNKGQILAKYTDNYYKDITSSVVFSVSGGSISGTSITPPTLNSGTQTITLTASYTEGGITQTAKKTYTAKAPVQTTYYWYVGTSIPSSTSSNGWTSLGTDLSGISYIQVDTSNNPDYSYPTFYVIMPSTLQFKPYNSDGTRDESIGWTSTTWSVDNNYTLWTLNDPIDSINSRFKQ